MDSLNANGSGCYEPPSFDISPQDFLNTVSSYSQQTAPQTSATQPVKLATVMALGASNTVQVQFDGETVTSTKYYPCLAMYTATMGERVALMPIGTTYLVIGAVGAPGANLTVTGDASIAGDLTVSGIEQGRGTVAFASTSGGDAYSSTETIVLTHNSASLPSGRAYRVRAHGLVRNNTANGGVRVRVRKTNVSGAVLMDSFTITTTSASTNTHFNCEHVVKNVSGSTINADLVMTRAPVTGGTEAMINAGAGLYVAFEVHDIGNADDYADAQAIT